jgi:hypothetical protein
MNLQFYDTDTTGNFVFQQLTTNIDRTIWHRVDVNVSFVDGPSNDVVKVYLDGLLLVTGTTWEDFDRYGPTSDGGGGGLSPVNSVLFRAGGSSVPANLGGGFYIDNVSLTSEQSEIPEPGTWSLLLGAACLLAPLARKKLAHRT